MTEVVLTDIKKMLGIEPEVNEFDIDVLSAVNSAFFTLYQLGIGSEEPIVIGSDTTWDDFTTTAPKNVVRDYVYLKVKMVFDPPSSSFVAEAMKDRIAELEFRLNIHVDNGGGVING